MAGFVLFTYMKPYFHFLLSTHGWSSEGLPTIEELSVSQATPEKKSTDKSPSRIQDLLSGDALPITLKHVTIQTLPLAGWKRKPCPNFLISYASSTVGGGAGWPPAHHTGSEHVLSFSEMSEDVFNTFLMGIVQWWIPIWKRKWLSGHFFLLKKVARWMILFSRATNLCTFY